MFIYWLAGCIVAQDPPTVTSIEVSLANPSAAVEGSVEGGTVVYIYGSGFSSEYALNTVYFGSVFCDPKNYASSYNQITCETQAAGQDLWNQNIYVGVSGRGAFQCPNQASCRFSFKTSATPVLQAVIPASAPAGTMLNFLGQHRITNLGELRDLGEVKALYIGGSICNRIDFNDDDILPDRSEYIPCTQGLLQPAGEYPAS
jgi:hypothetical protein